ncbi:MAG: anthranilate synthase component I [Wenzhouxiangellaceae bacterium]|nr:anthranilate synthase component I [Wenzhouxiangellaceae bacterium]MBS3822657.1 anthranilate synthase component I [Wenzhouxiangellaceae bacterium]
MDREQFQHHRAEGCNRIPVWRSVAADLDTPLSVYLKLADGPNAFLLESVEGGENWGRYSMIGLPCRRSYRTRGRRFEVLEHGRVVETRDGVDPLAEIERVQDAIRAPEIDGLPKFSGGLAGYFGYETVAQIEPKLDFSSRPDALGVPEILLLEVEELAVFDNLSGRLYLIVHADAKSESGFEAAERRLDQLSHRLRAGSPGYPSAVELPIPGEDDFDYGFRRSDFERAVERIKEYILAGDAMQVVLSQRMSVDLAARPLDVYRALRALNPSPYMYFFDFHDDSGDNSGNNRGDFQVVGSSPEVLVRVVDDQAVVRPIAGTRPRGATDAEDRELAQELISDPKERAEHLMLIDLGRNDIGRIAKIGSVTLTDRMIIERYSHVMHIVSQVRGELEDSMGVMDVLRATFPAGTLSGAPKVRAMEIIAELEPVRRGIYAGAVGWMNWHGDADFAIAIRTALVSEGRIHLQAGAGIVADSDPGREWEETMDKGRALIRAIAEASRGIR